MDEINNLKLEIEVLKKRISALEAIERRRLIINIIKLSVTIIVVVILVYIAYSYYQKVIDLLNNPLKGFF